METRIITYFKQRMFPNTCISVFIQYNVQQVAFLFGAETQTK